MPEFQPSVNLEAMELIWEEGYIREETPQTLAIRQAKSKDMAGYFLEMNRLRTQEVKAWTDALKTDKELLELRGRTAAQALQIGALEEELAAYRVRPGEVGEAESRVSNMMVELQREYELERKQRKVRHG